jgi:hypothetical protein
MLLVGGDEDGGELGMGRHVDHARSIKPRPMEVESVIGEGRQYEVAYRWL